MRRVYKTKSVTEKVYSKLRKAISRNELSPGQALNIETLAQELGVSRTPVREALLMLKQEGLVDAETRTTFVTGLSLKDLEEIFELREAVEAYALKMVARQRLLKPLEAVGRQLRSLESPGSPDETTRAAEVDLEFHRALVVASANRRLIEVWDQMSVQLRRFWEAGRDSQERVKEDIRDCLEILAALEAGSEEEALAILERHLAKTKGAIADWWLAKKPSEGAAAD